MAHASDRAVSSRIISAAVLLSLLDGPRHIVLLDVRALKGEPSLRPDYESAHIPGAHFVELSEQLQAPGGGMRGARPLPDLVKLQSDIQRWGIRRDSVVVVYGSGTAGAAARAWFVLTWAGVPDVRYLDGGLAAWIAAGGKTTSNLPADGGGTFHIREAWQLPTASADEIAILLDSGVPVFDARGSAMFAGDGSPRSGHIPGAVNVPSSELLDKEGFLRPKDELRALFAAHGARVGDKVGVYCGGGVAGALETLVLREIGVDAWLFVGSFSAWAADPLRIVASRIADRIEK